MFSIGIILKYPSNYSHRLDLITRVPILSHKSLFQLPPPGMLSIVFVCKLFILFYLLAYNIQGRSMCSVIWDVSRFIDAKMFIHSLKKSISPMIHHCLLSSTPTPPPTHTHKHITSYWLKTMST